MNDPASLPKRRGRPKGPRPALTSAQKMRRARERVQEALNAPEGEVARLADSLLLEALCAAYRAQRAEATWLVARELLDRLNTDTPPLNIGTVTENPGNPEHRQLFAIPTAKPSDSTALASPPGSPHLPGPLRHAERPTARAGSVTPFANGLTACRLRSVQVCGLPLLRR